MNLSFLPHVTIDARTIVMVLVFAAAFALVQAIFGLARMGGARRAVNRRLKMSEDGATLSDLVTELRKQRGLREDGSQRFGWMWVHDLVIRSGVVFEPKRWAMMIAAAGLIGAIIVFFLSRSPLIAVFGGLAIAGMAPIIFLKKRAGRRAKLLGQQLPDALEVIVRSLEAGHPVPTAMALVGRELPDPVGSEFGMAADELAYGSTLEQCVGNIADRCRHPDVDLFAATIRLQERSGGNLTGLLKMNAKTIRERFKMRLKIHAASSEGRASAMILTSAPFIVVIILQLIMPSYYAEAIHQRPVQIGLLILGGWMFLGNLVMRKMIDMRI
ncbi:MAG: type II secretion system F family protein [Caulobacteraceae bacterium]